MAMRPAAKRGLLSALLVAATVLFLALCVWQVERRTWKLDLIATVDRRIHAAAEPAPGPDTWPGFRPDDNAYAHVRATGTFLPQEALVQAVTEAGPGFWVLAPLRTADGWTVLVNRGFVPTDRRDPATRSQSPSDGPATVTGLLRPSEPGGAFLRSNDPANDRWFSRDVAAIAASRGLGPVAPYFIDADGTPNPGGYPVGGLTVVAFRNTHLIYAITWFCLAALSLFGLWMLWARRPAPDHG
ncbi:SURF1 family protein [Roseomonas elaeocarpi]|uniref:SURF1-like protein n=1 Tax=Roseomonas elaeocarpi TaxID=907779 RepID=A0ABV6JS13_9PROT